MATYGPIRYGGFIDSGAISGTVTYTNPTDLPTSNVNTGARAYVTSSAKLDLWNGTAWFNISSINQLPTAIIGNQVSYALSTDGTPTVVTLVSTAPEGVTLTWSYEVTSGSLGSTATVSQVSNAFTITPSTNVNDAGSFELTFSATDGSNTETTRSSFTLSF